ncbi:uncharacterized protein G2W53_041931 [Senna tora]|uniref:Uncharacterized protein n=1 Tax=Senna tora TaxID=362788 RepID=A0A834VZJ7_9FABA|nr:uncharacterized protein G2W53_041931 [Senna tora]
MISIVSMEETAVVTVVSLVSNKPSSSSPSSLPSPSLLGVVIMGETG